MSCDRCNQQNKGRYKTFWWEYQEGKKKLVTWCAECLSIPLGLGKTDKQMFEHFQIPFWKLMGQKPKPQDVALDKYLKSRGMTYGDWRRERDFHQARQPSALKDWEKAMNSKAPNEVKYKKN